MEIATYVQLFHSFRNLIVVILWYLLNCTSFLVSSIRCTEQACIEWIWESETTLLLYNLQQMKWRCRLDWHEYTLCTILLHRRASSIFQGNLSLTFLWLLWLHSLRRCALYGSESVRAEYAHRHHGTAPGVRYAVSWIRFSTGKWRLKLKQGSRFATGFIACGCVRAWTIPVAIAK